MNLVDSASSDDGSFQHRLRMVAYSVLVDETPGLSGVYWQKDRLFLMLLSVFPCEMTIVEQQSKPILDLEMAQPLPLLGESPERGDGGTLSESLLVRLC